MYKSYLTHEETSCILNKPWVRPEDILNITDKILDPAPTATTTNNFSQLLKALITNEGRFFVVNHLGEVLTLILR